LSKLAASAFESYAKSNLPELLKTTDGTELSPSNYAERRDKAYGKVLAGGTLTGEGKPGDDEAKMKMHLSALTSAAAAIQENKVFGGADDILLPYLDSLFKDTIDARNHKIFTAVTEYWEADYMRDMDALNVLRPDVITRVTAYVPQIVDFVDKIVQKGFAYESEGSVYFDIAAFEKAGNPYARLRPESKNDKALQEEGEGSLSKALGGKRGPGDFALWKKSKVGEPSWPSPWGEGRPGWHIECSVMASDILGSKLDIHSGGIDLAFPHHDNELAQSEAFYCEHGHEHLWVNYFMHMGHLSIAGSKMSKSLKNFQTIRDALQKDYTSRGMRIVFLLGRWNDGVEISPDMRTMADGWETGVNVSHSSMDEARLTQAELLHQRQSTHTTIRARAKITFTQWRRPRRTSNSSGESPIRTSGCTYRFLRYATSDASYCPINPASQYPHEWKRFGYSRTRKHRSLGHQDRRNLWIGREQFTSIRWPWMGIHRSR
jgi:cysteinyl-tRNA synthetase